jgi:hypothetical protein
MRRGLVSLEGHAGDEFTQVLRVLGALAAVDAATIRTVAAAMDHKGCLTVRWLEKPTDGRMSCVERAWAGAGESMLRHEWPGGAVNVETGLVTRTPD